MPSVLQRELVHKWNMPVTATSSAFSAETAHPTAAESFAAAAPSFPVTATTAQPVSAAPAVAPSAAATAAHPTPAPIHNVHPRWIAGHKPHKSKRGCNVAERGVYRRICKGWVGLENEKM